MAFYRSDVDCAADGMATRLVDDFLSTEDPDGRASELAQVIGDAVDAWFRETADAPDTEAKNDGAARLKGGADVRA
jgi:hypothetical protein